MSSLNEKNLKSISSSCDYLYLIFVVKAHDVAAGRLVVLKTADRRQHWARTLVLTSHTFSQERPQAKVPDWGDKVDSGIGLRSTLK
jgi:hypothetical protein